MFPQNLQLNDKQRATARELIKRYSQPSESEDCSGATPFHFQVYATGIGDVIHIVICGQKYWLDDGLEP